MDTQHQEMSLCIINPNLKREIPHQLALTIPEIEVAKTAK